MLPSLPYDELLECKLPLSMSQVPEVGPIEKEDGGGFRAHEHADALLAEVGLAVINSTIKINTLTKDRSTLAQRRMKLVNALGKLDRTSIRAIAVVLPLQGPPVITILRIWDVEDDF